MGLFERWLSGWVALAITAGIVLGQLFPGLFAALAAVEVARINLVIAVLIWLMIFPMMLAVDFSAVGRIRGEPQALIVTLAMNWLVKPFTMALLAWWFIRGLYGAWIPAELGDQLVAGMILLGVAPCTAMVFVWSQLCRGNATYTVVQVAANDLVMVLAYAPIAGILLGVSRVASPWPVSSCGRGPASMWRSLSPPAFTSTSPAGSWPAPACSPSSRPTALRPA
jgi:ACR3 family arsenite transporter